VSVNVISVASFLPSTEDMDAPFLGMTPGRPGMGPTPAQAVLLPTQHNVQINDAEDRNVIWDAEEHSSNNNRIEFEGSGASFDDSGVGITVPTGIRNEEGIIEPIVTDMDGEKETVVFEGASERAPDHVGDLVRVIRSFSTWCSSFVDRTLPRLSPPLSLRKRLNLRKTLRQ
jgi:meiosis-specific protein